jgi:hypothetical protein
MLRDVAAINASLDNDYGATRGPNTPAALEVALLETREPGSEITGGGYSRPTLDSDDWLPAADGVKSSAPVSMGTPSGAWDTANYAGLYDPVAAVWWDVVPLAEPLTVTGAGDPVTVVLSVAGGSTFEG